MQLNVAAILAHAADTPVANEKLVSHGLPITIEHKRGTQRQLHDDSGKVVYKVHMHHSYGYIRNTKGRDGDEVDCFVGPMKNAKEVYVIHMKDMGPVPSEREDEDKCMIGFPSADAAKTAFLLHYPDTFYNGMTSLPLTVFKKRLKQAQKPHREKKIHGGVNDEWNKVIQKAQCPNCKSKKFTLMPTDFETAKCKDCGKTYDINAQERL